MTNIYERIRAMSERVHIRQVADLKKSVANVRLMEAMLTKELSVALLIKEALTDICKYKIVDTIVTVNTETHSIDVLVTYQNRTPATVVRSIPFDKMGGDEIKYLFDCSNINPEESEDDIG